MMFGQVKHKFGSVWVLLALLLGGCAATVEKPHLYLLTSEPIAQPSSTEHCAPVAVAVQLPAYLERDGMVLQLDDNELVAAENHLWAEPLIYGVERLLSLCLNPASSRLAASDTAPKALQQVKVVVEQLHGDTQGQSRLYATWSRVVSRSDGPAPRHRFAAAAEQTTPGYDALVSVQRGLLLDLCQQMKQQLAHCSL